MSRRHHGNFSSRLVPPSSLNHPVPPSICHHPGSSIIPPKSSTQVREVMSYICCSFFYGIGLVRRFLTLSSIKIRIPSSFTEKKSGLAPSGPLPPWRKFGPVPSHRNTKYFHPTRKKREKVSCSRYVNPCFFFRIPSFWRIAFGRPLCLPVGLVWLLSAAP